MSKDFYEVQLNTIDNLIMDNGRNIKDEVASLDGAIESEWGSIYIPEKHLDSDSDVIKWLNERNAIQPNPVDMSDVLSDTDQTFAESISQLSQISDDNIEL